MELQPDSSIHIFTTHFYTKLSTEGVHSVLDWTSNRDVDSFTKKMVFIPIHKDHHWSLAVVINAGLVNCCSENNEPSEIPYILHLDSLSLHDRKDIASNVRIWLNAEWNKGKKIK
jgi:Ulp1 family protease